MARRGGARASKMTHSIKKMLRRHGAPGLVKAKKSKAKVPSHPGHKHLTANAKKRMATAIEEADENERTGRSAGTEQRVEAHKQRGKQARLEDPWTGGVQPSGKAQRRHAEKRRNETRENHQSQ